MNRALLLLALFGCTSVMADPGVKTINTADIQDSGTQYRGNFNVNQAAGDQHQQTNVRAIAIGTEAGATTLVNQRLNTPANPSMNATATIGGTSFSNGNGVLGVLHRRRVTIAPFLNRTWRCYQAQEQLAPLPAVARS
jgi:hypothetical protein